MDREYLGFVPLGSYESYLEDALPDSEFSSEILDRFETVNELHRKFENFCISYDSLLDELNNSNSRKTIQSIHENLSDISDIPHIVNIDNIEDSEIEEIKNWLNAKYEKASEIAEEDSLTDTLNYGESVVVKGIDGSEIIFTIDAIEISPTEGSEEIINIYLSNSQGKIISGHVKLIVGYLDFDEDGGVSDGANDEIEYEFHENDHKPTSKKLDTRNIIIIASLSGVLLILIIIIIVLVVKRRQNPNDYMKSLLMTLPSDM